MFFTTPMGIPKFNSISMPNNIEKPGVRLDTKKEPPPGDSPPGIPPYRYKLWWGCNGVQCRF